MSNVLAVVVWVCADAVGAEGLACGGLVACSASSLACYVFYLVSCEAFVEVGDVAVKVEDCLCGHADVDEESGECEAPGVAEVVAAGEGVVESAYAGWKGLVVHGLGVFFLSDDAFAGGERVLQSLHGGFEFGWERFDLRVKFSLHVTAYFFLEEAGGFVLGDGDSAVA